VAADVAQHQRAVLAALDAQVLGGDLRVIEDDVVGVAAPHAGGEALQAVARVDGVALQDLQEDYFVHDSPSR
jgi:hypothetical protein